MLILKQEDYNKIVDHAKKGLPNEACGLLGGYVEGDKRVVTDVYLLRNVDESREHFSMDPAEQLAAIKDIRQKKGVLLGNFHSHPESPSRPSQEDIRLAYDPKMNYLILSLMFSQTMFFLTDYIDIEAMQALKESVRIMRGKKGKLFYLQLSFMGIYLLGAIACGIGLLWVIPYMQVTMANFYRKITGEI